MNESTQFDVRAGLCDKGSENNDYALEQLGEALRDIGFSVRKKAPQEATLRVYPRAQNQYPLLNPRFVPEAIDVNPKWKGECIEITILSKDDDKFLDQVLAAFTSTESCAFVPCSQTAQDYRYHGVFVLPLTFFGERGAEQINFAELIPSLLEIHSLLLKSA